MIIVIIIMIATGCKDGKKKCDLILLVTFSSLRTTTKSHSSSSSCIDSFIHFVLCCFCSSFSFSSLPIEQKEKESEEKRTTVRLLHSFSLSLSFALDLSFSLALLPQLSSVLRHDERRPSSTTFMFVITMTSVSRLEHQEQVSSSPIWSIFVFIIHVSVHSFSLSFLQM